MTPEQILQLKKLDTFNKQPQFAIFSELQGLNDAVKALINATKESKSEVVSVDNLSDAKTDLTPLETNFEALRVSMEAVKTAIEAIPADKEMDMSGIEKLLEQIVLKEPEKMDMSHMVVMTDILDNILYAVQETASHSMDKEENPADKIVPELKNVQDILNLLNENVVSIEIPGFNYEKLAQIIKDNLNITVQGGSSNVSILLAQATFSHGAKSSIGTSALQMTTISSTSKKGVLVKAADSNSGIVYVGKSTVTAGTVDATDGFELWAGESVVIPVDNPNKIYVIASTTAQKVFWVSL